MKLSEIQQKLKAPKSQFNAFGKYHYRNAEDILEAVKPLLGKSTLIVSDEVVQIGERYYVKATAIFREDKTETVVTAYAREAAERKGMDESQITGATSSYARKYALNGLFLIDDTKDADNDDNRSLQPAKEPMKPYAVKRTVPPADDEAGGAVIRVDEDPIAQKMTIVKLLKKLGKPWKTVKQCNDAVLELTDMALEVSNYGTIIDRLETLAEERNDQ